MNDKLKNYTQQPDPEVWESISNTLDHRMAFRRRLLWGGMAGVAVVVAAVVVAVATLRPSEPADEYAMLQTPQSQEVQAVSEMPMDVPQGAMNVSTPSAPAEHHPSVAPQQQPAKESAKESQGSPVILSEDDAAVIPAIAPANAVMNEDKPLTVVEPSSPMPNTDGQATTATMPESADVAEVEPQTDESGIKALQNGGVSNVPDLLLWFPNVFSPFSDNGGYNRFCAHLNNEGAIIRDFRMAIYNRAGARVFFSNDINTCWDGTRQGRPLPQAAYVYVVFYTDQEGLQHHCKGTVTLLR